MVRGAEGATADIHEIQLLPNGNYLIGAQVEYQADATAYGGSPSSTVIEGPSSDRTPLAPRASTRRTQQGSRGTAPDLSVP